jgi:hypothetical protein
MPVISVVPDRFKVQEKNLLGGIQGQTTGENFIRRPVRGIQIKDDSFATLRVVAGSGASVPIIDAGSRRKDESGKFFEVDGKRATDIYSNFFIQNVTVERAEKQQILETFGEPFIFFFGQRAEVWTFSGILLNTFDFNWEAEWWWNYDNYLRGTRCVENDARVFLAVDESLITGYIMASAATKNAQEKNWVNFQFQMFITSNTNYSRIGNPNAIPGIVPDDELLSVTQRQDAEDLAPFRPSIIDTDTQTGNFGTRFLAAGIASNVASGFSLADGLAAQVNRISQTFRNIRAQAESTVRNLSDLVNGTVIRVPIGFSGAMEFDDQVDVTTLREVTGAGVIKYSTFDQNNDEYVGTSDQYGSAVRQNGVVRVDTTSGLSELTRNQQMVIQATAIWATAGFRVPPTDAAAVAGLMVKEGFGLAAVGSNAAWRSTLPDPSGGIGSLSPIRVPKGPGLIEE